MNTYYAPGPELKAFFFHHLILCMNSVTLSTVVFLLYR